MGKVLVIRYINKKRDPHDGCGPQATNCRLLLQQLITNVGIYFELCKSYFSKGKGYTINKICISDIYVLACFPFFDLPSLLSTERKDSQPLKKLRGFSI